MMKVLRLSGLAVAGLALMGAMAHAALAQDVAGRWNAVAKVAGVDIPFRLDLKGGGDHVSANFFDGPRPTTPSTEGAIKEGRLHLLFPSYAARLDAVVVDDTLDGAYVVGARTIPIHAVKAKGGATPAGKAPDISGEWLIPTNSPKGEKAWRLIVRQTGAAAEVAILRIDGDTGTLNGRYADGTFHLSHFAGERPAVLDITPQADGTLKLVLADGEAPTPLIALRPAAAEKLGLAPEDPTHFTTVRDPAEPFAFAFPDLNGRLIANTDPKFKGKVVIIDIMGSWCPNCHDETPFLQALYSKYSSKGLEIVALDFESGAQVTNPERLRAFIQRYGVTYTVLLAGERKDVHEKLPQMVNFNAWPTTFFINRNGTFHSAHVGFTSPGSGPRDVETRQEVEKLVQTLLAQPAA
jgi:thiol-disulfide isomerase/thioredoxin